MKRSTSLARLALMVAALASSVQPLQAQADQQLWRWVDGQGGFCVWYLSDPDLAPDLVAEGTILRSAAATASLPAVLGRIIQDEPRFSEWIPGVICVGLYAAVASDGVAAGRMEDGPPVLVTLTAVAAEQPLGKQADWYLAGIGLDAGHLDRIADRAWIASDDHEMRIRNGLAGENDQWELRMDGLKLFWQGHPTGGERVGTTRSMSFGYAGNRNSRWLIESRASSEVERGQVGTLRVEGKSPLAMALKSSPIRAIGALEYGGEMTLSFTRELPIRR